MLRGVKLLSYGVSRLHGQYQFWRGQSSVLLVKIKFSHLSTNQGLPCLAPEVRGDQGRSGWYGLWEQGAGSGWRKARGKFGIAMIE